MMLEVPELVADLVVGIAEASGRSASGGTSGRSASNRSSEPPTELG